MNLLGIDLEPLKREITKFNQNQQQILALLEKNNEIQTQILIQLGGKPQEELNSLNPTSSLK